MTQNSGSNLGGPLIIAAVVIGASIVTGSFLLKTAHDENSERLTTVLGEMQALSAKVAAGGAAPARPAAAAQPGRPDPDKVYQVAVGNAPVIGPSNAQVTAIVFLDYQ